MVQRWGTRQPTLAAGLPSNKWPNNNWLLCVYLMVKKVA